jgi:hypothetical protein
LQRGLELVHEHLLFILDLLVIDERNACELDRVDAAAQQLLNVRRCLIILLPGNFVGATFESPPPMV